MFSFEMCAPLKMLEALFFRIVWVQTKLSLAEQKKKKLDSNIVYRKQRIIAPFQRL